MEENILSDNLMGVDFFWTHFYSPYADWLKEEFDIEVSALIKKGIALPSVGRRGDIQQSAYTVKAMGNHIRTLYYGHPVDT